MPSIFHGPYRPVRPKVELALLLQRERAGADTAEDGDLVPGLVHGAIAIQALGKRGSGRGGFLPGDELRPGLGAEAVEAWLRVGRRELHDLEAILAVGDVCEERG